MKPENDIKYEKKKQLFLDQKKTLDSFLKTGAISRLQYDKSYAAAIHVYEKAGYREIEKPEGVVHATMNRFFIKDI